ncbi:MAG: methyltransferase domain-containing protein [Candidatus Azotimanducaceae bacterium]
MQLSDIAISIDELTSVRPEKMLSALLPAAATNVGCLIVAEEGKILGILTDGDLRRGLSTNQTGDLTVEKAMTRDPISMPEHTDLPGAFNLMSRRNINHLLVRNDIGQETGIVSFHSIAQKLSPEQLFIDTKKDDLSDNERRHIARYNFAASFFSGSNKILDGACGCGYGSNILAATGASVVSVDLNMRAIDFAINRYGSLERITGKIDFRRADLTTLCVPSNSLDGVVSLETLEHVDIGSCRTYIKNIRRWIKPGGILVASSPMLRYRNGKPYVTNPFHINEQPKKELLEMFHSLLPDFQMTFFHQKEEIFVPLDNEETGFCIAVGRKRS